jgi:hypothetical protein
MKILKISSLIVAVILLTVVTQVGGIILLLSLPLRIVINRRTNRKLIQRLLHATAFITLYLVAVFVLVPIIAKPFGRVPLPAFESKHVRPTNIFTCLMLRNYIRPEMRQIVYGVADKMNQKYPGSIVNYLDANFPFYNGFPLFPHLSHNDGKKLDISFYYKMKDHLDSNDVPSFIGYGVCEGPLPGEEDKPSLCRNKGYWQYNALEGIVSQKKKSDFIFDDERTRTLITQFTSHNKIEKLFIEPHLKTRMKLTHAKIRYHGCQAVRHDDHIHVQLK